MLKTSYSEASYFDGYAFQHIADYLEHERLARIKRDNERRLERLR